MALIENLPLTESVTEDLKVDTSNLATASSEELKIVTSNKVFIEESPMSENLKGAVRKNAPEMSDLFQSIINQKGEDVGDINREGNTIHADKISPMTLHLFALEAAKLGKTITYKEEKSIIISD